MTNEKIKSLREMALEVGEIHAHFLEVWEARKQQSAALSSALYSLSGLEPQAHRPTPDGEPWVTCPALLVQACDNILSRMLGPQQGGDAEARETIEAVRAILISASKLKPGMSKMGRLTAILNDWNGQNEGQNEPAGLTIMSIKNFSPEDPLVINDAIFSHQNQWEAIEPVEEPPICGATITGNDKYECYLHNGHGGSHLGRSIDYIDVSKRESKLDISIEMDGAHLEVRDRRIGLFLRGKIGDNQVVSAEASDDFVKRSWIDCGIGRGKVYKELSSAIRSYMMRTSERVTVLSWKDIHSNGMVRGRILVQENSHLIAHFVNYDFSDGTTGPESLPEYVLNWFRRSVHERMLQSMKAER